MVYLDNHSRVRCQSSENYYLNACTMKSIVDGNDFAIFAQAPTPTAIESFWEAIYEKNVKTIIMLCSFYDPRRGVHIKIIFLATIGTILAQSGGKDQVQQAESHNLDEATGKDQLRIHN
jgi:protein tyrosine phosphatase